MQLHPGVRYAVSIVDFDRQEIVRWIQSVDTVEKTMALHYQIIVKGHLDASWSAWFDGLTITHDADGNTRLTGAIRDQTALYGLLDKARDLALTLVAVEELTPLTRNGLDPPPDCDATRDGNQSSANESAAD